MKGFLTFTLAAGVAITTTAVAQAVGVGKGAMNLDKTTSSQTQGPMSVGAMGGLSLDRAALNRELNRLTALLQPDDELLTDRDGTTAMPVKRKGGSGEWTGW